MEAKISAVIFDMDGVITNTMPDHFRVWKKVFTEKGIHVTHLDIYSREGQRGINSVREIFRENNRSIGSTEAKRILRDKEELFKRIVKRRFIVGARKFLHYLDKKGLTLALVTGTSRHELHRILPDYIYNLFKVIITGNDVKHGKPHPEPYLKALRKLKMKPAQTVVIENAPFGIQSAKDAAIRCLALTTSLPRQYLNRADYIFSSIKNLENKVEFILAKTG